jgi:regulator of protease activity HflC (stomatin/prohibitin superfamily)
MSITPVVRLIGGVLILFLLFVIFLSTYFTVAQNERAVVSSWGQFGYVADPGLHFKMPFRDSVTDYPVGIMSLSSGDGKWVNTYTVDNQEVDIAFTIFYRIPPDKIAYLYANNRDYSARLWSMAIDRLKAAMGQVNVQMVAEKRGELRDRIKAVLVHDAAPLGVEVTDFQLTDLQYTKSFREAVGNAAVQKALIESREYERQQAEKSALTAKITAIGIADKAREEARGAADARLLQATAEAKAIQLQGEAQAAAIKAQAEALKQNSDLTELRKAERWDGKLPTSIYAGAPIPFMQAK